MSEQKQNNENKHADGRSGLSAGLGFWERARRMRGSLHEKNTGMAYEHLFVENANGFVRKRVLSPDFPLGTIVEVSHFADFMAFRTKISYGILEISHTAIIGRISLLVVDKVGNSPVGEEINWRIPNAKVSGTP